MAQRKEVIREFVAQGIPVSRATKIAVVPKSSYYYRTNGKRKGKAPSTHTLKDGTWVENTQVLREIERILEPEFIEYGYQMVTGELRNRGYHINPKKVYRLMKENRLLSPSIKTRPKDKTYVQYTSPRPQAPFRVIEVDIKYIHVHGQKANAYLITLLDVFSRYALEWVLAYDMKTERVITLIDKLLHQWIPAGSGSSKVILRSDNGPQFIAKLLREKLGQEKIDHEFIQPGTPQQNGHIESFHATVQNLVCNKYTFENLEDARQVIGRFMNTYNNERNMKATLSRPPAGFLRLWSDGMVGIKLYNGKQKYYLKEGPKPSESAPLLEALVFKAKINQTNNVFLNP